MADILTMLVELGNGRACAELHQKMAELIREIRDVRKPGKLVFELKATPSQIAEEDGKVSQVQLTWAVKLTKPVRTPGLTTFFTTKTGELQREDPDQNKMFEEEEAPIEVKHNAA